MVDLARESGRDPTMPMAECCRVGKPDSGQINRSATCEVDGQRKKDARHITVRPVVDHYDHAVGLAVRRGTHPQEPPPPATERIVNYITTGKVRGPSYHAASKSARAAASSPVKDACQAAAAAMRRRSR